MLLKMLLPGCFKEFIECLIPSLSTCILASSFLLLASNLGSPAASCLLLLLSLLVPAC